MSVGAAPPPLPPPSLKLGKLPPKVDIRTFEFSTYLAAAALPKFPPQCTWSARVPGWGMMANDRCGDCTCASAGHILQAWTTIVGRPFVPDDGAILDAYSAVSGFDPYTGANDNGAVILDVMNLWRRRGIAGHQIAAFASVSPAQPRHVMAAIYLFGAVSIGLSLPYSASIQLQQGQPWDLYPGPYGQIGTWGGHCVPCLDYDATGLTCVTWGRVQRMTWGFFRMYADEAYAPLSQDWIAGKKSPSGFNLAQLRQDLAAL